mgnify:CR=1 FL=1
MPRFERKALMEKFQDMRRRRIPIVGGGAGTGLSAKCEEEGGIDLIVRGVEAALRQDQLVRAQAMLYPF